VALIEGAFLIPSGLLLGLILWAGDTVLRSHSWVEAVVFVQSRLLRLVAEIRKQEEQVLRWISFWKICRG
jgi:hypothetical protein